MPYIDGMKTDRSFSDIDARFGGKITSQISEKLHPDSSQKITVCDIACGPHSRAIRDIVKQNKGKIRGIGLDYMLETETINPDFLLIRGDLFDMDNRLYDQADITYCAYILGKLARFHQDYLLLLSIGTEQISRTLKVGGVAFIDEGIYSLGDRLFPLDNLRNAIAQINPNFLAGFSLELEKGQSGMQNYLTMLRKK